MDREIKITKNDALPLIYFIVSMFQKEYTHRQGTSSKSDLIGGYLDRWINKIPEDLIFSKLLLKNKSYSVINDYFLYGSSSDKNAPDILGLKYDDKIIPFTKYVNNTWVQLDGMPHIEIKTFRKNQKMVSIRDTQLKDDDFYILVESNLKQDYLIKLFNPDCFNDDIFKKLKMDDIFIENNKSNIITNVNQIVLNDSTSLGTISIIRILKGKDFKQKAVLCNAKEDIYYLKDINEVEKITSPNCTEKFNDFFTYNNTTNMYFRSWNAKTMLPIYANESKYIKIVKVNKKSLYIETTGDCSIYNYNLKKYKKYKIEIELFERSSGWNEYIALKNQFSEQVDVTEELMAQFEDIINENIS